MRKTRKRACQATPPCMEETTELTTDDKAELALQLWENLVGDLLGAGVMTGDEVSIATTAPYIRAHMNGREDIKRHLDEMLKRLLARCA